MNTVNVITLALIAISAVAAVQGDEIDCPSICPALYMPTCGTDGKNFEKFDNPCALSVYNCNRQRSDLATYSETDIDWCTTTEIKQFDADFQEELGEPVDSCMRPCPMIYNPVCGSNGTYRKMFTNECEMNTISCIFKAKSKNAWKILKIGKCSEQADE